MTDDEPHSEKSMLLFMERPSDVTCAKLKHFTMLAEAIGSGAEDCNKRTVSAPRVL